MKSKIIVIVIIVAVAVAVVYWWLGSRPHAVTLTGIVATDDVQVSSQVQGRVQKLLVRQGDTVRKGQLLAVILPEELRADKAYYEKSERESAAQVEQARADLKLQEEQTREQIRQATANLAMYNAQVTQAEADLESPGSPSTGPRPCATATSIRSRTLSRHAHLRREQGACGVPG